MTHCDLDKMMLRHSWSYNIMAQQKYEYLHANMGDTKSCCYRFL